MQQPREELLQEARRLCIEHDIAVLFHEYGFNRVLHWNAELGAYELRAKIPGGLDDGIHVTSIAKFIAMNDATKRARLQTIKEKR